MSEHDPMCRAWKGSPAEGCVGCRFVARVRADERKRIDAVPVDDDACRRT